MAGTAAPRKQLAAKAARKSAPAAGAVRPPSPMEPEDIPSTTFDADDADIILASRQFKERHSSSIVARDPIDRVLYRAHRARLSRTCSFFKDMFEIAEESKETREKEELEVIQLEESSKVLDLLLAFVYADEVVDCPALHDLKLKLVLQLWNAAIKYGQSLATISAENCLF